MKINLSNDLQFFSSSNNVNDGKRIIEKQNEKKAAKEHAIYIFIKRKQMKIIITNLLIFNSAFDLRPKRTLAVVHRRFGVYVRMTVAKGRPIK